MNVFLFLKGELRQSKGVFFGLTVLLALALAVAVSVIQTERMVKSSTIRAADQFDILVGTKGSRSALLLGTVYLRDEMLSLVPMPVLNNLSPKSSDISWAAPLAFGDRAGKASLVGTTRVFVDQAGKRTLLAGRNFEKPYEAVAGSNAGFSINDEFHPGHGMSAALGHEHKESFRIVGILPETGTPWDRAVLIPIETLWSMHGQNPTSTHDVHGDHIHEEIEAWLSKDMSKLPGASALVVKPTNMAGAYRIRQHLLKSSAIAPDSSVVNLMAVFTGEALIELFAVFAAAASALKAFAASSVATSLAAALLTGFVLAKLREKDLRLLRTMGAPRRFILASVWASIEAAIVLASLGALILGTALSVAAGMVIASQTGISMMPSLGLDEIAMLAVVIAAGAVFAVIPACAVGNSRLA